MARIDFETHLQSEIVAPFVVERVIGGAGKVEPAPIHMIQLAQPRGDFSDPPLSDLVITIGQSAHRTAYRNGDYRFSGRARPGQWSLFARGEANSITIDDPNRFLALAIPAQVADPLLERMWPQHRTQVERLHAIQTSTLIPQLIEGFWGRAASGLAEDAGRLFSDALLTVLIGELMHTARLPTPPFRGGLAGWQLRRATEYIEAHHDRDIALADLAALCGLSDDHFARAFRRSVGMPPYRYQLRLRLERAQILLRRDELPLAAVAAMVGFARPQGLTRLFLRELGVTPLRYRRDVLGR